MHDLRGTKRSLKSRIPWRALGIAASLVVIAAAFVVLYRMLQGIEVREVVAAIRTTSPYELVLAGVFVAIAYFTLTFYDYFALRTIGRGDVPYRVAALASFTSYSIGHNVGFSVVSGGTVRYRVYSGSGLSGIEVAKICFIAGLTFWLGNLAVLGLGAAFDPEAASAINLLPHLFNRGIGVAILVALAGYVLWVSMAPRRFGRDNWTVTLPGGNLTFLQILIGIVDLACASAAMYVLMPDQPYIDFPSLMVIFVLATLLGFASNSPGGLGVFDAAMLLAMPQFAREDLVGALLLFRLYYYVVPFALALAIIGIRELLIDVTWVSAKIIHPPDKTDPPRD